MAEYKQGNPKEQAKRVWKQLKAQIRSPEDLTNFELDLLITHYPHVKDKLSAKSKDLRKRLNNEELTFVDLGLFHVMILTKFNPEVFDAIKCPKCKKPLVPNHAVERSMATRRKVDEAGIDTTELIPVEVSKVVCKTCHTRISEDKLTKPILRKIFLKESNHEQRWI